MSFHYISKYNYETACLSWFGARLLDLFSIMSISNLDPSSRDKHCKDALGDLQEYVNILSPYEHEKKKSAEKERKRLTAKEKLDMLKNLGKMKFHSMDDLMKVVKIKPENT